PRRQRAVASTGGPAALGVTQDDRAYLVTAALLDGALQRHGAALEGALRHDDDARSLAALLCCSDEVSYLVGRHRDLGDEDGLGAARYADAQSDVPCASPHDLD